MPEDLNTLYQQTIDKQRNYLLKLQSAFNEHCDQITVDAEKKLNTVPMEAKEQRDVVMKEQKMKLDQALSQLRREIESSSLATRKKLEEINNQREQEKLKELENMINQVS